MPVCADIPPWNTISSCGNRFRRYPVDEIDFNISIERVAAASGYLRKRLPQELMVFQGGISAQTGTGPGFAETQVAYAASATAIATGTVGMDHRVKAKMQGYEGDPCGECGNYTLVRNGTCMKCNTCGGTSGCS